MHPRVLRNRPLPVLAALVLVAALVTGAAIGASRVVAPGPGTGPEVAAERSPTASPTPRPSPSASRPARSVPPRAGPPEPLATAAPTPVSAIPTDVAGWPRHRVATRVVVPGLGIDLPVMPQETRYPACNVAMYLEQLRQPGEGGATYLYAHARRGMFLPLLQSSQVNDGAGMIGLTVHVYTGDNRRFTYRIDRVRRHARDLNEVLSTRGERLWLQTSEGPRGTVPKLQVAAAFVESARVSHAEAHPRPRPVACG